MTARRHHLKTDQKVRVVVYTVKYSDTIMLSGGPGALGGDGLDSALVVLV